MAKKPISDAEFTSDTPTILRWLERQHYDSPEWKRGNPDIKNRGLGNVDVPDQFADDVDVIDSIPKSSSEGRYK